MTPGSPAHLGDHQEQLGVPPAQAWGVQTELVRGDVKGPMSPKSITHPWESCTSVSSSFLDSRTSDPIQEQRLGAVFVFLCGS